MKAWIRGTVILGSICTTIKIVFSIHCQLGSSVKASVKGAMKLKHERKLQNGSERF